MVEGQVQRSDFKWFFRLQTRWSDNDMYGHINNAMYYSYLDTVLSEFLKQGCDFNIQEHSVLSVVASSQCDYFKSVAYPDHLEIGVRIEHIGNKSVKYGVGFFKNQELECSAIAKLTEVWIDKASGISVKIPDLLREKFLKYLIV